jgi:hypothetical protein
MLRQNMLFISSLSRLLVIHPHGDLLCASILCASVWCIELTNYIPSDTKQQLSLSRSLFFFERNELS